MTLFFRLLESDNKGTALQHAIQQLAQKQPNPSTFVVEPESFQKVPGAPFAYWVSEGVLSLFRYFKPVSQTVIAQHGASSKDDFRINRIRDVLKVIWGDKDSDIEQEACEILKVSSLLDYFRKSAAFFNEHLGRYSKNRRQAPIYLPLSTRSGSIHYLDKSSARQMQALDLSLAIARNLEHLYEEPAATPKHSSKRRRKGDTTDA